MICDSAVLDERSCGHVLGPRPGALEVTPIFLSCVIVGAGVLQWYTEMQAEMLMDALRGLAPQEAARVVRRLREARQDEKLDASELVPGDIIFW